MPTPSMTAQEVFDTVVRHLYAQRRQAISTDGRCKYRAPGGLKCAVGVLIPDDKYTAEMDWSATQDGLELAAVLHAIDLSEHHDLCEDLRLAHDWSGNWTDVGPAPSLVIDLRGTARDHGLSISVLEEELSKCPP